VYTRIRPRRLLMTALLASVLAVCSSSSFADTASKHGPSTINVLEPGGAVPKELLQRWPEDCDDPQVSAQP
jgi:hypothetical protein